MGMTFIQQIGKEFNDYCNKNKGRKPDFMVINTERLKVARIELQIALKEEVKFYNSTICSMTVIEVDYDLGVKGFIVGRRAS